QNFDFIFEDSEEVFAKVPRLIREGEYDAVLMASCVAGPELRFKEALATGKHIPVIGLQHGFFQLWEHYENHFDRFDLFGVFGPASIVRFAAAVRYNFVPLLLQTLVALSTVAQHNSRRIRVALQSTDARSEIRSIPNGRGE